jgi:hypothetical protein
MSPHIGKEKNSIEENHAKNAYELITCFHRWKSGRVNVSNPEAFEGHFNIQKSVWYQLREKLSETDKK